MLNSSLHTESLKGSIERVTFHSSESGFCVLKIKAPRQKDLITVIGNAASITPGEYVDCFGEWHHDKQYGLQFKASRLSVIAPNTVEGIEKYLGSGLVKGIGPHFAAKLVKAFGMEVFEVIEKEPNRLKELPGIGKVRAEKVVNGWKDQKNIREIVVFLQSHGVGTARAVRIYKTYGKKAIEKVTENPYRLALDIHGIGFKTADNLAQRLGIEPHSILRAEAGVRHTLQEITSLGHCAYPIGELTAKAVELLDIPENIIEVAILNEIKSRNIIKESIDEVDCVFLGALHAAEVGVVKHIKRLFKASSILNSKENKTALETYIREAEFQAQIVLSESQLIAVKLALEHKVVIITGGPGVGKTTVLNTILRIIRKFTQKLALGAPTGRAAKRLSEATSLEAKTIHRLLEYDPQMHDFRRSEQEPLDADWVVIDETSMIDIVMAHKVLKAVPSNAGLVLVGDVDQLPSVGPGSVLANLIDSGKIPTVRLTEIFRQAKTSQIILNAHTINKGYMPKLVYEANELTDFYFIEAKTPETIIEKLLEVVANRIPKRFGFNPLKEIQVLVPMNRGKLGARSLNMDLQALLNSSQGPEVNRFGWSFKTGDKVIQTVNNYDKDVFNGDIGFIKNINLEDNQVLIEFDNREIIYEADELDEIALAYATTIHKSQGSEYPAVVIPLATQHFALLERNLVYTGITRGKSLVVIIGQKQALGMAIKNLKARNRLTNLSHRLAQEDLSYKSSKQI